MLEIKCDLCNKVLKTGVDKWIEEHATVGCSGFNFTWCEPCSKDDKVTGKMICESISKWREQCIEYWRTHPEELEDQHRRTEEYRKTLTKEQWETACPKIRDEWFNTHPGEYERVYGKSIFKKIKEYLTNLFKKSTTIE